MHELQTQVYGYYLRTVKAELARKSYKNFLLQNKMYVLDIKYDNYNLLFIGDMFMAFINNRCRIS